MARRSNHGNRLAAGVLAQRAIAAIVPAARLRLTRIQLAWPQVAQGPLRRAAWPGALKGRLLVVFCRDTQWQHELAYRKRDLLLRLRVTCPDADVDELRMRVGEIPPPFVPHVAPEQPQPLTLPPQPADETVAALNDVQDDVLRTSIANARQALSGMLRTRV